MNSKAPAPSLNGHTERGLLFLLFCAMGCWLWRPIQHENDIFWHLASGRYMLENHRIPRLDVFSFTAAGHPWVNHEWLFQIPAFLAVRLAGISGIILLKILLILGAFYFISRRLSRNQIPLFLRWAVLALVFWGSRFGWNERADLVSIVWLAALMDSLSAAWEDRRWDHHLRFWPIGFALWANMHGGVILGIAVLGLYGVGLMLEEHAQIHRLGLWMLLCLAATFLNPWGYHLHVSMLGGAALLQTGFIREWMQTPWHPLQLFWGCLAAYWLLFAAVVWREKTIPWSLTFTQILLSWGAIRHVRNVPYFMVGAFPAAGMWMASCKSIANSRWMIGDRRHWLLGAAGLLTLGFAARQGSQIHGGIDDRWQPVEACSFIRAANIPGRFFNDYAFGGYWTWFFGTARPDFIDGRLHTVDGFVDLYHRIETAQSGPPQAWEAFLNSYGVDAALVRYPEGSPLPAAFEVYFPRDRWALIYWDDTALLFMRRAARYDSWIHRYEFPVIAPEANPELVISRMRSSRSCAEKMREDLRRNERLHPKSLRIQRWRSICDMKNR